MCHGSTRTTGALLERIWFLCSLFLWLLPASSILTGADERADRSPGKPFPDGRFALEHGDVVAFVGGSDVAAAQHTGHLETLLTAKYRGLDVHFRNFGWEGDTVFAQPRDVGFPPLRAHLERVGASVIILQFGRSEALSGREALSRFVAAYEHVVTDCARQTPRIVLVTPPPFENPGALLPNLSKHNPDLAAYAQAIRDLARQRGLPLVDLFRELSAESKSALRLTDNGLQLTPRGHALVARAFVQQLGFGELAGRAGEPNADGSWPDSIFEQLRQAAIAKNRFWFDYWRPQNWAFLGGDRTSQPSSRDHRDPKIRWFPEEMERFIPLIEAKEKEMSALASQLPL